MSLRKGAPIVTPMPQRHATHPHGSRPFEEYLLRKYREQPYAGTNFDPSDLAPRLIPFFMNEVRIQLVGGGMRTDKPSFGTIAVTTGWRPTFVLKVASNHTGSVEVIGNSFFDRGGYIYRTKPVHGTGTYKPFIQSPRYHEIVAWYQLTLKIPRPIITEVPHDQTLQHTSVHQ